MNIEQRAKELAGNWRKWKDFSWRDSYELEDSYKWSIVYTRNRDTSDPVTLSNTKVIDTALNQFLQVESPNIQKEYHTHWACGWIEGYAIKVYDSDGDLTPEILVYLELMERIENYPILDENAFDSLLMELQNEAWEQWVIDDYRRQLWKSDNGDIFETLTELFNNDQWVSLISSVMDTEEIDFDWDDSGVTLDTQKIVNSTTLDHIVAVLNQKERTENE